MRASAHFFVKLRLSFNRNRYNSNIKLNGQPPLPFLLLCFVMFFVCLKSEEERNNVWEANMPVLENNPAIKWFENMFENRGRNQEKIEIAQNMLRDGDDVSKVARITGLDITVVTELQKECI
jgi:hypothetical protein